VRNRKQQRGEDSKRRIIKEKRIRKEKMGRERKIQR